MHFAGLISYFPFPGVMAFTGQFSAQVPHSMQVSVILYDIFYFLLINQFFILNFFYCFDRTSVEADSAFNAFFGIDNIFFIAFRNCFNGTFVSTSSAHNAGIVYFIFRHRFFPPYKTNGKAWFALPFEQRF